MTVLNLNIGRLKQEGIYDKWGEIGWGQPQGIGGPSVRKG